MCSTLDARLLVSTLDGPLGVADGATPLQNDLIALQRLLQFDVPGAPQRTHSGGTRRAMSVSGMTSEQAVNGYRVANKREYFATQAIHATES